MATCNCEISRRQRGKDNIFNCLVEYSWVNGSNVFFILSSIQPNAYSLTHWGRVTHICVSKLTIIGSDNGLSPDRRQAIIWTNAGLLLIGPLGTNLSEILIEILSFSFKIMRLKVSSAKRRPFCFGLDVLTLECEDLLCIMWQFQLFACWCLSSSRRQYINRFDSNGIRRALFSISARPAHELIS